MPPSGLSSPSRTPRIVVQLCESSVATTAYQLFACDGPPAQRRAFHEVLDYAGYATTLLRMRFTPSLPAGPPSYEAAGQSSGTWWRSRVLCPQSRTGRVSMGMLVRLLDGKRGVSHFAKLVYNCLKIYQSVCASVCAQRGADR